MLKRLVYSHNSKMTKLLMFNNSKSLFTNSLDHINKFPCFIPPNLIHSTISDPSNRNLAYGVHMDGHVQREGQNFLWHGKRSQMKPTYPGMLDHLVAGGLPYGIPCAKIMMKKCVEEARTPRFFSQKVKPVSAVSYTPVRAVSYTPFRAVSYKDLHEPRVTGKARSNSRSRALDNCPQKQGICLRLITRSPKKPNSAVRKLAKVRLSNRRNVLSYIPGEGHSLQEHSVVLVRGGRVKDLPGVKFHCIRGVKDLLGIPTRRRGRSKYGSPKPKSA